MWVTVGIPLQLSCCVSEASSVVISKVIEICGDPGGCRSLPVNLNHREVVPAVSASRCGVSQYAAIIV